MAQDMAAMAQDMAGLAEEVIVLPDDMIVLEEEGVVLDHDAVIVQVDNRASLIRGPVVLPSILQSSEPPIFGSVPLSDEPIGLLDNPLEEQRHLAINAQTSAATDELSSQDAFQVPLRRPPTPEPQAPEEINPDATECTICMEPCSAAGKHRLSTLRCGHLFGKSCISRWIGGTKKRGRECPNCKAPCKLKDIVPLFCTRLLVLDTKDRDDALALAAETRAALDLALAKQKDLEKKLSHAILLQNVFQDDAARTQKELMLLKGEMEKKKWLSNCYPNSNKENEQVALSVTVDRTCAEDRIESKEQGIPIPVQPPPIPKPFLNIATKHVMTLYKIPNLRVIEFSRHDSDIFVCHGSSLTHHVSRMQLDPYHETKTVIHTQSIRDCCSSPHDPNTLLTTGLDKTLKLFNVNSQSVMQSFSLAHSGWACSFHPIDPNVVIAGTCQNSVELYDARMAVRAVESLSIPWTKGKGVHSLFMTATSVFGGCFDGVFGMDGTIFTKDGSTLISASYDSSLLTCWRSQGQQAVCLSELPSTGFAFTETRQVLRMPHVLEKSKCVNGLVCVSGVGIFHPSGVLDFRPISFGAGHNLIGGIFSDSVQVWSL